jgi:hypothetical protein
MIAVLLAAQLTVASSGAAALTYKDVPSDIVRVALFEWQNDAPPAAGAATVERHGNRVMVRAVSARRSVIVLERQDGAYLLDGPFWWPPGDLERALDRRWRRTILAPAPEPITGALPPDWLSGAREPAGQWPRCFTAGDRLWSCWGVPVGDAGVIVGRAQDRTWWTVVSRGPVPDLRASKWGRLLLVDDVTGEPSDLRIRFAHPVIPSAQRIRGLRLDTANVPAAQALLITPGSAWLSGDDFPPEAWVEVRTSRAGPAFIALRDVADGPSSLALTIRVEETRPVDGAVVGARDQPANAALVTLFRLIDPSDRSLGPAGAREKPRRVLIAETIADGRGAFHIDGTGDAEYEVVAWHSQLGRASALLPRQPGLVTIRLESPGTVSGRVIAAGKPRAGVDVISLPAPKAYREAEDLVDLKGGDARTGADGRFSVMAAAGGGGELRVGGGSLPIRRIPLPRVPVPLLDLGDIELGSALDLTVVLDQDSSCGVRATGPIGQSGLQIVLAVRTAPGLYRIILPEPGVWAFGLLCGREGFALSPPTMQITPAHAGKEVRFSVR